MGGVSTSSQRSARETARRWAADPLSLMWVLLLAALVLVVVSGITPVGQPVFLAGLAAVIAGVSLSGST